MDWVKLSTRYYLDSAIAGLPDADTEVLFTRSLAYAGFEETGGVITEGAAAMLCRRRRYTVCVDALVAAGLWLPVPGGYQITRWEEWQEELDKLAQRRAADRDRKRRERAARKANAAQVPPTGTPGPVENVDNSNQQVRGMSRDMSVGQSAKRPQDSLSSLRSTTGGIESREIPPYPPQAGGHRSRCKRHKARPKTWCEDCQAPPLAPVPDWCRRCDERTRHIEAADGRITRCPDCHPLADEEAIS